MRIHIMKHAINRIKERLNKKNCINLAYEAFESKEEIPEWFLKSENNLHKFGFTTYIYRYYLGTIWVFQKTMRYDDYNLITIYKKKYNN